MAHNLLNEIEIGSKNGLLKKRIITHYMHNGSSTIPDLARELNLSVPTVTKFINEMCALEKLVYLAYRNIRKKWTMPLANWGKTAQQLAILYPDRFKLF